MSFINYRSIQEIYKSKKDCFVNCILQMNHIENFQLLKPDENQAESQLATKYTQTQVIL